MLVYQATLIAGSSCSTDHKPPASHQQMTQPIRIVYVGEPEDEFTRLARELCYATPGWFFATPKKREELISERAAQLKAAAESEAAAKTLLFDPSSSSNWHYSSGSARKATCDCDQKKGS